MKKLMPLLIISFYLIQISGYAQVTEKGKTVKEEKSLPAIEKVTIEGGGNIYIHQSASSKIELRGTKSIVQNTEVKVIDQVLEIHLANQATQNSNIDIHIYTPVITEIEQRGGGKLKVEEGYKSVDQFKCTIHGGGTVDLAAIPVNSLSASIEGGGEISARVNKQIVGKINGGGQIFYHGVPKVESDIQGGGVIKRK